MLSLDLIAMISVAPLAPARAVWLQSGIATFFAGAGIGLGVLMQRSARRHLRLLIAAAMGVLLAIVVGDILPEAKHFLAWRSFLSAGLSGYLLLWAIGRYVYHVCPACTFTELEENQPQHRGNAAGLLMLALGVHCLADGAALALAGNLLGHPDVGLLIAISIHKIPEGLALILLLLQTMDGAGKAVTWALAVEGMTLVGGLGTHALAGSLSLFWLGVVFAHIAGGFLYLIVSTVKGVWIEHASKTWGYKHAVVAGASFLSSVLLMKLPR